ncbi:hypothetical protein [Jeongeupia sp. USM3]|uniref:hypothetical protein n=1 Tax=Jeongeupia sp. USM3 TaxID=1906741 RepID=UPI00089DFDD2|nr:hypothetical protein [Jeongeupia sp. USM3]AOY00131.1 hypothetical protein BJP62_06495 [Jeongeupia sp. USM3]
MNRAERRATGKPRSRLTPIQVFQCLITPRAALARLAATGRIDHDDFGALQCIVKIGEMLAQRLSLPAPDTHPVRQMLNQIDLGEAIDLEQIEHAQQVLEHQIAKLYRATPSALLDDVHITIRTQIELAPAGAWEG